MNDYIVLLNEQNQPIGRAPKLPSHNMHTPYHLAFSCYLFNEKGEFLLTRRARVKKVWPGFWTNSVCGHPREQESLPDAVTRRARYELGITELTGLKKVIAKYSYITPPFKGVIENEFCPIYVGITHQEPALNSLEVEEYQWVPWRSLEQELKQHETQFSYWLKDQYPLLKDNKYIQSIIV